MKEIDYPFAVSVLILAVGVIGATVAAAKFYAVQLRETGAGHDGLLLWHVTTIGVSVALTWVMLGLGQLDILGIISTPRWVRLVGYDAGGVGTIAALVLIALLNRRRVQRREDAADPRAATCPVEPVAELDDGPSR